jgi:predicted ester cyclase
VRAFYDLAFNQQRPEEAVERYVGARYTQHNPTAGDGTEPFIEFVKSFTAQYPELSVEIKRVIAEGDLVVTHGPAEDVAGRPRNRGCRHLPPAGREGRRALGRAAAGARDRRKRQHDVLIAAEIASP